MGKFVLRRVLQAIPTFLGITAIAFIIMVSAPGDPISLITFNPARDPAAIARMERSLGLDQPPVTQYVYWLVGNDWTTIDVDGDGVGETPGTRQGLLRGDLGQSIRFKQPVLKLIAERIPATLQLALVSLVVGYGIGIGLGVLAAVFHKTWVDWLIRVISVIGNAIPPFWLGLVLIIIFSVQLGVLPMGGMRDIASRGGFDLGETFRHMLLPVFVFSLNTVAFVSRFVRTELLEVLAQDYVRTAYAKGLTNRTVWLRHAAKNALIPVATYVGVSIGTLLSGAVIIEQVFDWPGMGRLVVNAVFNRDYPLVMGSVVIGAIMFIIGIIFSDFLYALLDPRIRLK
ncbi:MAG: ABC transporter permease [Chloroflexi bacterium]|nr:ABC transporter permease [Chloroflexota bacterium]